MNTETEQRQQAIKAAVFDRLVSHLQDNTDVQNIDLMILADFCRNCLAKWYVKASEDFNADLVGSDVIDYEQAREIIYGMPYSEWKDTFQLPATEEQLKALSERSK